MESSADPSFFSSLRGETHFYILRHGQSEGNAKRVFQGLLDLPLVEEGRAQARSAAAWFAAQGVGLVLASPLARAAETGRIIAEACGADLRCEDSLREIDTGVFSGLGFDESRERYPEAYAAFEWQSWDAVPGADKADALYLRAMEAWAALRGAAEAAAASAEGAPARVAAVSHGGFIQWLVRATFGAKTWMPLVSAANCGIFELFVDPTEAGPAYVQWRRLDFVAPEAMPAD
jgi:broad specificity phosphatase PhoE